MTAEAAEGFFAAIGATVDQRLEAIATAARILCQIKNDSPADVNHWAIRQLDLCSRTFCRPPPVELVELIARQLHVNGKRRTDRKNRAMFFAAAKHKAKDPSATAAQICRAIGYDQKRQVKKWMADPEFCEIAALEG
jgi:hypothetical protein